MKKQFSISVIMPVYNCEKYLSQAIESVYAQGDFVDSEIIVIDDGSSDNSVLIANKYNTKVIKQNHLHAAAARNNGIKNSSKDWVFFLDSDDTMVPDAFKILLDTVSENPNISCIFSYLKDFVSPELSDDEKNNLVPRTEPYTGAIGGATFVKRSVFDSVGFFDETLSSGEGVDWIWRVRNSSFNYMTIDKVTAHRRLHLNNTGRVNKEQEARNIAAVIRRMHKKSNK